jgi:hypothetical protein
MPLLPVDLLHWSPQLDAMAANKSLTYENTTVSGLLTDSASLATLTESNLL